MVKQDKDITRIRVKVLPRSSKNEICGTEDNVLKVKLTAPPVDGKANKALIALLSRKLGIPKKNIHLTSGHNAKIKTLQIEGHALEAIMADISSVLDRC
jgi:uncharacterized protein (TIGR00251 family)